MNRKEPVSRTLSESDQELSFINNLEDDEDENNKFIAYSQSSNNNEATLRQSNQQESQHRPNELRVPRNSILTKYAYFKIRREEDDPAYCSTSKYLTNVKVTEYDDKTITYKIKDASRSLIKEKEITAPIKIKIPHLPKPQLPTPQLLTPQQPTPQPKTSAPKETSVVQPQIIPIVQPEPKEIYRYISYPEKKERSKPHRIYYDGSGYYCGLPVVKRYFI